MENRSQLLADFPKNDSTAVFGDKNYLVLTLPTGVI